MANNTPEMDAFLQQHEGSSALLQAETVDKDALFHDYALLVAASNLLLTKSVEVPRLMLEHIDAVSSATNIVPPLTVFETTMLAGQASTYKVLLESSSVAPATQPNQKAAKPTPTEAIKTNKKKS